MNQEYKARVDLLLRILPYIAGEESLALKGGTAINMFIWDMPRLSVDIDLVYMPFDDRATALTNISKSLVKLKEKIIKEIPHIKVESLTLEKEHEVKLLCMLKGAQVKIEINTIMRGTINPTTFLPLNITVQKEFGRFAEAQVLSRGEIFGGKICAALDRQHPRDLFDVAHLLEEGGITEDIKQGFIAALLSHPRPINEVLNPGWIDQTEVFEKQFSGMASRPFTYEDFENTRKQLVKDVHKKLTDADKELLLSFKSGSPYWELSNIAQLQRLPAIQWKHKNIKKLAKDNPKKHFEQLNKLKEVLYRKL